jgi:WhiB family redox-sensing transcriptional regulator
LLTTDVADQQEEKVMSITVLDTPSTGVGVDEEQLPCHREDPELFFAESPSDVELAKSLCGTCPVRAECLASAIERREPWGVWGGQLLLQGVVIPRKRPRGRPRKNEVAA